MHIVLIRKPNTRSWEMVGPFADEANAHTEAHWWSDAGYRAHVRDLHDPIGARMIHGLAA